MDQQGIDAARNLRLQSVAPDAREYAEVQFIRSILPRYQKFIDVGANVGQYAQLALEVMATPDIVCVEANPELTDFLEKEFPAPTHGKGIRIVNAAVSDTEGSITFYISGDITVGTIVPTAQAQPQSRPVEVPSILLDSLYETDRRILVKMDIEGAEYRALAAAAKMRAASNVDYFVELHGWGDSAYRKYPWDIYRLMAASGYRMWLVGSHYMFSKTEVPPDSRAEIKARAIILAKYVYRKYTPFLAPLVALAKRYRLV